jgi:YkoY family integral membrane protein
MVAADVLTILGAVLTLVVLEGLLSADNALVLAVMVRHLPKFQQKRALRYGIWGAFIFRAIAVVCASSLLGYWWLKVLGGAYLLFLAAKHFLTRDGGEDGPSRSRDGKGFWWTVLDVELADIMFSIDSILAAVGLAEKLPKRVSDISFGTVPWIGDITLKLVVIYIGGVLGIIAMRMVAGFFLIILERRKGLAEAAYLLVAWIGLELGGSGLHMHWKHLPLEMPDWLFWLGMALIVAAGLLFGPRKRPRNGPPDDDSQEPSLASPVSAPSSGDDGSSHP